MALSLLLVQPTRTGNEGTLYRICSSMQAECSCLSTGTKREVKRRLPTGVQGGRRDQRMNDEPHAQRHSCEPDRRFNAKTQRHEGRDVRSLCAFASLRFIQRAMNPCPAERGVVGTRNPPLAISRNNLTQRIAPAAQAKTFQEPAGHGLFSDLSTMSRPHRKVYEQTRTCQAAGRP